MITSTLKSRIDEDICVMLNFENHAFNYLCDCGYGSLLGVKDCRDTAAIFVSHTHIDHFINFDQVMRHQLAIGRKVVICGPKGLAKNVQCKLLSYNWDLLAYDDQAVSYEVREVNEDFEIEVYHLQVKNRWALEHTASLKNEVVYENEVFSVRYAVLSHGVDCIAYRFEEHPKIKMDMKACPHKGGKWIGELKTAFEQDNSEEVIDVHGTNFQAADLFEYVAWEKGYSLCYVMDFGITEQNKKRMMALCQDADKVLIESYYKEDDRDLAIKNNHSTAKNSATWLKEMNVKSAQPVHFSRRYHTPEANALIVQEFFDAFRG